MSGVAYSDRRLWWESIEEPIGATEAVPAPGTDAVTWRNGMRATDVVLEERIRRAAHCEIFRNCGERAVAGLVSINLALELVLGLLIIKSTTLLPVAYIVRCCSWPCG